MLTLNCELRLTVKDINPFNMTPFFRDSKYGAIV